MSAAWLVFPFALVSTSQKDAQTITTAFAFTIVSKDGRKTHWYPPAVFA